jgi:ribosomal RNA-processing protein 7
MPSIPKTIGDFSVLPLSIPPLPSYPHTTTHYVYARRHAPNRPTPDDERSLFVTNVPVDSTEPHFRAIIATLAGNGKFESISFEADRREKPVSIEPGQAARLAAAASRKRKRDDSDSESEDEEEQVARLPPTWTRELHRSGSTAVIVLADEKSVDIVLKAIAKVHKSKKYPVWGEGVKEKVPPLGAHWIQAHNNKLSFPPADILQQSVDVFFAVFNRKEKEAAEMAKRMRNEPDEDGFVTVTRGASRAAPARRDEAEEARRRMLERERKQKEELTNFYRFQLRERKKAEQAELIKKFDEDRRKVRAMTQKRGKFRPES